MTTVRAVQKFVRQSPRKLRLVADMVRGKELGDINSVLSILNKRGANVINETIRQAVANAVNNMGYSEEQLSLSKLMVNEGPRYKRFRAGARGRAKSYVKRSSHILVELAISGIPETPAQPEKVQETAPVAAAQSEEKKAPAKKAVSKKAEKIEEAEVVTTKPARSTKKKEA